MRKLTIEITDQQHKHIKAMAAVEGLSMKEFVLDKVITSPPSENEESFGPLLPETEEEFYALIRERLANAEVNGDCGQTMQEIFDEAIAEVDAENAN